MINRISKKIIYIFFIVFAIAFFVGNIFSSSFYYGEMFFNYEINTLGLLFAVVLLAVFKTMRKKEGRIKEKLFLFAVLMFCFISGLISIINNNLDLIEIDDSYNVFNAAKNVLNGEYNAIGYKSYLNVYPNNIGLMTYFLIHIKLFGEFGALVTIRFVNLLFIVIGFYNLYKICNLLFKDNMVNIIIIALFAISNQFSFIAKLIYGNALSYSLSIVSIYYLLCYLENKNGTNIIVSTVVILAAVFLKSNSLIILIAECIFLLIEVFNRKKLMPLIAIAVLIIGQFVITTGLQTFWGNKAEIDYSKTKLPTICWVANGINYDSRNPGRYTNQFEVYHMANDLVPEYTAIEAKRFINDAVTYFKENPKAGLEFYAKKFLVSFANPTYECLDEENIVLETIWDASSSIVAIGLVMFLIKDYKKMELNQLIGIVVVIGGFLFHAFWETKAVYCYQYYLFLLPYAACGLKKLFDICSSKK